MKQIGTRNDTMDRPAYVFDFPLSEGIIQRRKGQFIMEVETCGGNAACHCPTTGRIGSIELAGRPCLLSRSADPARRTPYTVEALSLDKPDEPCRSWIGINQNAANRYVEHYILNGGLSDITGENISLQREQVLGSSKIDFLAGDTYIEVKTPLQSLQVDIPDHVRTKKTAPFSSTDRFVKHITELAGSLQDRQRAILLTCFLYDNPGFRVVERSTNYKEVSDAVAGATAAGVELWQANFRITPQSAELTRYFRLHI